MKLNHYKFVKVVKLSIDDVLGLEVATNPPRLKEINLDIFCLKFIKLDNSTF